MPAKPKTGGKSYKKKANTDSLARDLVYKGESEVYGVCTKVLGCGYYTIYCLDGVRRRCHLRGALKKRRVMMHAGDLVLVSLREFSTETDADIVHKYQPDEVKELKKYGEIVVDLDEIMDREIEVVKVDQKGGQRGNQGNNPDEVEGEDGDEGDNHMDNDEIDNL